MTVAGVGVVLGLLTGEEPNTTGRLLGLIGRSGMVVLGQHPDSAGEMARRFFLEPHVSVLFDVTGGGPQSLSANSTRAAVSHADVIGLLCGEAGPAAGLDGFQRILDAFGPSKPRGALIVTRPALFADWRRFCGVHAPGTAVVEVRCA